MESAHSGIDIVLGFECTARSRPATVEWVREMLGKHGTLGIDKTVLVSRSGFTAQALKRAHAGNALPLALEEATDADWLKFVEGLSNLHVGSFTFRALGGTLHLEGEGEHQVDEHAPIRLPERGVEATLSQYTAEILHRPDLLQQVARSWLGAAESERKRQYRITASFHPNDTLDVHTTAGEWRRVTRVDLGVEVTIDRAPLKLSTAALQGHQIAFGTAPNIFPQRSPQSQYVLVNLVGHGGRVAKASILFPGSNAGDAAILRLEGPDEA